MSALTPYLIGFSIAIGILALIFLIYGYSLPVHWEISEKIKIKTHHRNLFEYLNSLKNWPEWTAWRNPDIQFEGPEEGPGATQTWKQRNKKGRLTILESERPDFIRFELSTGYGKYAIQGSLRLVGSGEIDSPEEMVEVEWKAWSDAAMPAARIILKVAGGYIQKDFAAGLAKLKALKEGENA